MLSEGLAAAVAAEAATLARDPVVSSVYAKIAADEAQHAELAWDTITWCLEIGRDAHDALQRAAASLDGMRAPELPAMGNVSEAWLADQGVLSQRRLGELFEHTVSRVRARSRVLVEPRSAAA